MQLFYHKPKVYLLVPINKPTLSFCRGLRTHLVNGYNPILVNFGIDSGGSRANKYFKIRGVYNWIQRNEYRLHSRDIISIVDGFDCYSQLPPENLARNFLQSGRQILVGADKNCFPNDPNGPVCNDIPQSEYSPDAYGPGTDHDKIWADRTHTRPRWVNSGTIIGYKAPLEKLYASMVDYKAPDDDHGSDQRVFAVHYYWNNFSIAIDFKSELAVSVAFSEWELDFYNNRDKAWGLGITPLNGVVPSTGERFSVPRMPITKNRLMGYIPVFVHFPGVARSAMQRFEDGLWWTQGREDAPMLITEYARNMEVTIAETDMKFTYSDVGVSIFAFNSNRTAI